ncbi:MAG: putative zinc-binding metallopeptidase [Comamonadaceae bacterium]|nr:putative zinc-binding metallopeptidase [Comamonadaceae bacterium]
MLEVDGGTRRVAACRSCATRPRTRSPTPTACTCKQAWRRRFGRASRHYPESYLPRPGSRNYVVHLDHWYAQSHPAEDWAETFAVWLDPRSRWRERYHELAGAEQTRVRGRSCCWRSATRSRRCAPAARSMPSAPCRSPCANISSRSRRGCAPTSCVSTRSSCASIFPAPRQRARRERASRFVARLRRELLDTVAALDLGLALPHPSDARRHDEPLRRTRPLRRRTMPSTPVSQLVAALVMLYMGALRSGTARLAI